MNTFSTAFRTLGANKFKIFMITLGLSIFCYGILMNLSLPSSIVNATHGDAYPAGTAGYGHTTTGTKGTLSTTGIETWWLPLVGLTIVVMSSKMINSRQYNRTRFSVYG